MAGRRRSILALCLVTSCIIPTFSAFASETVNYSYDSRGRLVQVGRSGSVNNGLNACYAYDRADNRTNVAVANANCPSFSVMDVSAAEGSALVFTIVRSGTVNQSHSVNFATSNGTAVAGSDYSATSGALTFGITETAKTVSVATTNDTTGESSETVTLTLSGATGGATITDAQGVGSIHDNDTPQTPPSFSITDPSVSEGGSLTFTVSKTPTAATDFRYYAVDYITGNGTATSPADYQIALGTLSFAPAETSKTVTVATIDDYLIEGNETLYVNLSAATLGSTISDAQGIGTINDNDVPAAPSFAINDASGTEGGTITFTVTKTGATSSSYSVNYATANGTATSSTAPIDYYAKSGTLTFSPSQMTQTITITLGSGQLQEEAETFYVNLSNASGGATIADDQGVGTIFDDDGEYCPPEGCN